MVLLPLLLHHRLRQRKCLRGSHKLDVKILLTAVVVITPLTRLKEKHAIIISAVLHILIVSATVHGGLACVPRVANGALVATLPLIAASRAIPELLPRTISIF